MMYVSNNRKSNYNLILFNITQRKEKVAALIDRRRDLKAGVHGCTSGP